MGYLHLSGGSQKTVLHSKFLEEQEGSDIADELIGVRQVAKSWPVGTH
jgi:hypothetical protein